MSTAIQDVIEREILVRAPKEQVYKAIADPKEIVKWFPDGVEGRLAAGESAILNFEDYGKAPIYVVAAESPTYFAYRWLPGGGYEKGFLGDVRTKPNTLVEFRLEDAPGGTRVRLKESGFAGLPQQFYEEALKDNNQGWDYMLDRLQKLFDKA